MSDAYGNTASPTGDIGPEATDPNITNEAQTPQEPPMSEAPSLTQEEQDDMNALSDAFDRARNAVINASQLAKDVAVLREECISLRNSLREEVNAIRAEAEQQVTSLRQEVEALRAESSGLRERNAMLDEHLVHARQQRNDAQARVSALEVECASLREQRDTAQNDLDSAQGTIALQRDRLSHLRSLRQQDQDKITDLERSRDALRGALDAIKAIFASPEVSQPDAGQPEPGAY